jgi:hypothetical protein
MSGTNAGFKYTLIGGGNRLSAEQPLGPGFPAIIDGYNFVTNRVALTSNNGAWPNLISLDRLNVNDVEPGQSIPGRLHYQWMQPTTSVATVSFYLDADLNPLNGNERLLGQTVVHGSSAALFGNVNIPLEADITPGILRTLCKNQWRRSQSIFLRSSSCSGRFAACFNGRHRKHVIGWPANRHQWSPRSDGCHRLRY